MKKNILYAIALLATVVFSSCNDEWKDEQYEQMISFKSSPTSQGVTWQYLRYNNEGSVTYNIPIIISGSTANSADRVVNFALDTDTLSTLNVEKFGTREELYFKQLPEQYYSFPKTITIPKGQSQALLPVTFNLNGIDMADKWVLPIKVADGEGYKVNYRKYYSRIILYPMPFNEFTGNYSGTQLTGYVNGDKSTVLNSTSHRCYAVNDSTVFFYAGNRSDDYIDRKYYKMYYRFTNEQVDKSHYKVEIYTDCEEMNLKVMGQALYSVQKEMDYNKPYLEHTYITISDIEYEFEDFTTSPGFPLLYHYSGSMSMQRDRNTLIPDEDQAIQW